jgi:neopullulanase
MPIETPDWVKHAIFYQIFPDRFARSPRTHHPPGITLKPWGTPPAEQGFQGGDLRGIVDRLDYLQKLGITALYLNPIFASASNHRYHTFDYYQVDPLLGGNDALRELLDAAHARGMRVVLDGVFNHASRGFWAFHHILETGPNSPYLDWFIVKDWPLRPYGSTAQHPPNYACWYNLPALPKFNTNNPGVRRYLLEVARYWIEFGADGWRLDVPTEIADVEFWREFRQVVKGANPQAYLCGEIWHPAPAWLQGDQFDAVMNYIFTRAALCFFGAKTLRPKMKSGGYKLAALSVGRFAEQIDAMHALYDWQINYAQLNLLDSHDTPRALTIMGGDKSALRLAVLFQMTMPGAPCIYYGSEIGMAGAHDPGCREAFPWEDEGQWDTDLLAFYRRVTALRHRYPVLRTGDFCRLYAHNGVYAFGRTLGEEQAIVLFNTNTAPAQVTFSTEAMDCREAVFQGVWGSNERYEVSLRGRLRWVKLPAREALVLVREPGT